ncbi:MAG: hypothetical protein ACI9CF_001137 [Candidatus Omnitrophota bacterium]|jgi:hypothetical protein
MYIKFIILIFSLFILPSVALAALINVNDMDTNYVVQGDSRTSNVAFTKHTPKKGKRFHSTQERDHYVHRQAIQARTKDKYRNHIETASDGGFVLNARPVVNPYAYQNFNKQVLRTKPRPTTIYIPRRQSPNARLNDSSHLTNDEMLFLNDLSGRIDDKNVKQSLAHIMAGQKELKQLSQQEYNFLISLSKKFKSTETSLNIYRIAEKRRESTYTPLSVE